MVTQEEEELKRLDEELKELESGSYGSPEPKLKDNIFRFFKEILFLKDTTRIGNLSGIELGATKLGTRHFKEIGLYAHLEGLDKVADYLYARSEILTSTSMSKKGFWPKLFVTQIKKEQKIVPKEEKKGWFNKKTQEGAEEE
jgi:hypothetical protein